MKRYIARHEKPMGMKDGERVQEHVGLGKAPASISARAFEERFWCVSIAPFERPVVPDV